ncbi:MAG: ankyrin repeat domain-containing protein [Winogradskyella sp.]|uniref:ankyrin repeat domain-containing protein n=1 Tax=Winogradskyella sp. TaxID=1883156 RepID=UPI000F4141D3|nr:ankyrin repeat domain-containing protein [Winogradskyella sp.]RNC80237.1 MAG: ankyrin repeat domain-containing protein [Winogradskyella sp.]
MKSVVILFLSTIISIPLFAQESNIFHDRKFWKQNPSVETIEKHIAQGNDITSLNSNAFDAVSWALIEKTDNATIKYLLDKKDNGVNKLTHDGRTYIFWAAYKDNIEMMQYLVDKGAKTDIVDSHGYSVLNFAATTGQLNAKLYDFIFKHGADITKEKSHNGANALLLVAPFLNNFELVDYFISKGADLNTTDNNGNGIFNYAAKGGNLDFLQQLINKGITYKKSNNVGGNAIIMASQGTRGKQNTIEVYKFLENKGLKINVVGAEGRNPLHNIAYRSKDLTLIQYLIDKGIDVNKQDAEGYTPFINASNSNSIEVVKTLYNYVDDINKKDNDGRSALTKALNRNKTDVVKFLIEKGGDINVKDKEGNSLMYYLINAFRANAPEAFEAKFEVLKSAGLDLTETQGNGKTLYHLAVEKSNLELLKRIGKLEIDINKKNGDGLTALHLAAMKAKNQEILMYLISQGADKTVKTEFEESVYDLAMENEILQKNEIDISFLK